MNQIDHCYQLCPPYHAFRKISPAQYCQQTFLHECDLSHCQSGRLFVPYSSASTANKRFTRINNRVDTPTDKPGNNECGDRADGRCTHANVGGVTPGSDGDSVGGTQNANDRSSPREVFVRPNNIRTKRFVRYNPIISTRSATRSGTYYGLQ